MVGSLSRLACPAQPWPSLWHLGGGRQLHSWLRCKRAETHPTLSQCNWRQLPTITQAEPEADRFVWSREIKLSKLNCIYTLKTLVRRTNRNVRMVTCSIHVGCFPKSTCSSEVERSIAVMISFLYPSFYTQQPGRCSMGSVGGIAFVR